MSTETKVTVLTVTFILIGIVTTIVMQDAVPKNPSMPNLYIPNQQPQFEPWDFRKLIRKDTDTLEGGW